ncbi:DUF2285 domain-containing protein [Sinorhizobium sp. 7-81]|uniref:DUF2285 domain-containing protein n=1 Tax=Sinorhizobium sp. 8-89 TaxID=3049089 RepID=UPI0024C42215|nr:DUF2285 domain-containing protein [Sinorhizobium sp. 8-89]MDK1492894.1 DUF2285 domain-containing protein [Sinorhizobium sp. 8-89]
MSCFPVNPYRPASNSNPIWVPQLYPATLIVAPAPPGFEDCLSLDPGALPIANAVLRDGFHVCIPDADGLHRLWFPNGDAPLKAAVVIPLDAHLSERLLSLQRWHRWLSRNASRPWPRWQRFSPYRVHRFSLMLRAWDGVSKGAARQEVASVLLNPDLKTLRSIDWKNTPERRRVHRLLKAARALIEGGYSRLLKPGSE